jgi:hypothetical protein
MGVPWPRAASAVGRPFAIPPRSADVVYASDYGFDPDDATSALQQALDATASVVVIDDVGAEWLTRPLSINRDDLTLIVAPGVTVRALPGGYPALGDCLLTAVGRSHLRICGYGATLMMNKAEYGDSGQWRHVLAVTSSSDVVIEGITLAGAGGDGIYLGRSNAPGLASMSESVTIRNVRCVDNYRNGLSVISANKLLIDGCAFVDTLGHAPQAGIDFEPNSPDEQLTEVCVRNCVVEGNASYQIVVSVHALDGTSTPLDVAFDNVRLGGGQTVELPTFLYNGPANGQLTGVVSVRDSLIESAPFSGSWSAWALKGVELQLSRVVFVNWGNPSGKYAPLTLLATLDVPDFGGVTWTDCLLLTDQPGPFLRVQNVKAPTIGVHDLHGNLTLVDPNGATTDLGPNPRDITLDTRWLATAPASEVEIQASVDTVPAGQPITLTISRTSADLAAPLAVRYATAGTAGERVEFDGMAGMAVIPPGQSSARVRVRTRRSLAQPAPAKTVTFTIEPAVDYTIGSAGSVQVSIT